MARESASVPSVRETHATNYEEGKREWRSELSLAAWPERADAHRKREAHSRARTAS
jgi:hypothetical protein